MCHDEYPFQDAPELKSFCREFAMLVKAAHDCMFTCKVYGFTVLDGQPGIVMKFYKSSLAAQIPAGQIMYHLYTGRSCKVACAHVLIIHPSAMHSRARAYAHYVSVQLMLKNLHACFCCSIRPVQLIMYLAICLLVCTWNFHIACLPLDFAACRWHWAASRTSIRHKPREGLGRSALSRHSCS